MTKTRPTQQKAPVPHELNGHEASTTVASALGNDPLKPPRDVEVFGNYGEHDADNGRRLLHRHGEDLRFVQGRRFGWNWWDGNCWLMDETSMVDKLMEQVMRDALAAVAGANYVPRHQLQGEARWLTISLDASRLRAAMAKAAHQVTVKHDVFDQNPWLIPCANGLTYDLSGDKAILRESRREDLMSHCLPVNASREPVPHPRWDAFILLLMNNDEEMVRYLTKVIGLLCTGDVSEKCFWFWNGDPNTGKSTLLAFIHALLGGFACKLALRAIMKRREELTIRHDLADLEGKRFAYCEEMKRGDVLHEGTIKDMIGGGGKIKADRKGEANIEFANYAKLIIGTNELPAITDVDEAIRNRVRAVPFEVDIVKHFGKNRKAMNAVVAELMEEAPGILQCLVDAVMEWKAAGCQLGMPPKVEAATRRYLDMQDPLATWMETCCVDTRKDTRTEERPFSEWYLSFRMQSGRSRAQASERWFSDQLGKHKFSRRDTAKGPRFTGPRLTDPARVGLDDALVAEAAERSAKRGGNATVVDTSAVPENGA